MPAIVVDGLVKRYSGRAVVDGLSFDVEAGEVLALLGPNGAGKTTTVEILEGFRTPDAGAVRVLGQDPGSDLRTLSARIGVMPQDGRMYARIKPAQAIRQFASFYDDPMDPEELLVSVGLGDVRSTPYRRLSGGEQQRLSLALAVVGRPEVAFLDEPTTGMDVHARAATWNLIRSLREGGTTVLLTTHLIDEAERAADRVAIIHRGRLRAIGSPGDVAASAGTRISFSGPAAIELAALDELVGGRAAETVSGRYTIEEADTSPAAIGRLTSWFSERGLAIAGLTVGSASLEDVFVRLTKDD
jgi:ABC-2 type transport system ATP-binding protein